MLGRRGPPQTSAPQSGNEVCLCVCVCVCVCVCCVYVVGK